MTLSGAPLMPARSSPRRSDGDFQRLALVRARLQSRRRWRLAALSAIALAGVILSLAPVERALPGRDLTSPGVERLLWTLGAVPPNGARGDVRGSVTAADRQTGRIRVGWGLLGMLSVPVVVTADTRIIVGDKEGGFGDIVDAHDVAVTYEVRARIPEATRVEILRPGPQLLGSSAYR
jgi:hypothetical protein